LLSESSDADDDYFQQAEKHDHFDQYKLGNLKKPYRVDVHGLWPRMLNSA